MILLHAQFLGAKYKNVLLSDSFFCAYKKYAMLPTILLLMWKDQRSVSTDPITRYLLFGICMPCLKNCLLDHIFLHHVGEQNLCSLQRWSISALHACCNSLPGWLTDILSGSFPVSFTFIFSPCLYLISLANVLSSLSQHQFCPGCCASCLPSCMNHCRLLILW